MRLLCRNNFGKNQLLKELRIFLDILINTVLESNLASLKLLETYFKIADIFKIKAVVLLPKSLYTFTGLNLRP